MNSTPEDLHVYRFVVRWQQAGDPRSASYLHDAHALGLRAVHGLECQDLYFIEGQVDQAGLERLAAHLLSDPVTQLAEWGRMVSGAAQTNGRRVVEVALRPGVTDPVAAQIVRAAKVLGIQGVAQAATGLRFLVAGPLDEADLHRLARRLLANPTIQRYALGELQPVFPHPAEASGQVETLPLRGLDGAGLLALSAQRRAALDLPRCRPCRLITTRKGAILPTWSWRLSPRPGASTACIRLSGRASRSPTSPRSRALLK
jgi:phosphoribosylformylglycinamidine synthase